MITKTIKTLILILIYIISSQKAKATIYGHLTMTGPVVTVNTNVVDSIMNVIFVNKGFINVKLDTSYIYYNPYDLLDTAMYIMKYSFYSGDTQINVITGIYVKKNSNDDFEGIIIGGGSKTTVSCARTNCQGCNLIGKNCSNCEGTINDPPPNAVCVRTETSKESDPWWKDLVSVGVGLLIDWIRGNL